MAKNLTLGRILALMPHCCNGNGNGNSITTVEHTLNLNQDNVLDLSGNNNKQIAVMYIDSCNKEGYDRFMEGLLTSSDYGSSFVELFAFEANSENDLQSSFEVTLDSTTYALMISFGLDDPMTNEYWVTHNSSLPVTANSHNSLYVHPISLEDLISENGVKIYSLSGDWDNYSSINEAEDFKLYCQYNSETNKLTLSVAPFTQQNNLVSTVTVNGITAQDQVELPSLEEIVPTIDTISIISGYPEAIGSDEYFNELSQNDVDNLNQTEGIAIFIINPTIVTGGGIRLTQVENSPIIEANIENEEVTNDFQR